MHAVAIKGAAEIDWEILESAANDENARVAEVEITGLLPLLKLERVSDRIRLDEIILTGFCSIYELTSANGLWKSYQCFILHDVLSIFLIWP